MDGYVLVEVNDEGSIRIKETDGADEIYYFDHRLRNLDLDRELIMDSIEFHIQGLNDSLVMVFFTYESVSSGHGDYWSVDYEDCINYKSCVVVKKEYKEFYRMLVKDELKLKEYSPDDQEYYENLVASWEEFYDEDFQ